MVLTGFFALSIDLRSAGSVWAAPPEICCNIIVLLYNKACRAHTYSMLRTKWIKAPIEVGDGLRISVMSRHTLNDGSTPDPDITPSLYQEHWSLLAPPAVLMGDYYKRGLPWSHFVSRYGEFLREPHTHSAVESLVGVALTQAVTIMCIEELPEFCHRRLLAQYAQLICPELEVNIA